MPWQELSPVDLRMQFVTDWQSGCWTMSELCADYRVSRKTGRQTASALGRDETPGGRGPATSPGGLAESLDPL